MSYFKTKLIIVIIFVFITLHDAYGTQRNSDIEKYRDASRAESVENYRNASRAESLNRDNPSNTSDNDLKENKSTTISPISTLENRHGDKLTKMEAKDQKPGEKITVEHCIDKLDNLGHPGNKNYLDHYIELFYELNKEKDFDNYDTRVGSYVFKCIMDPYSIKRPDELEDDKNDQMDDDPFQYHRLNTDDEDDNLQSRLGATPNVSPNASPYVSDTEDNDVEEFDPPFNNKEMKHSQSFYVPNNTPQIEDLELLFTCDLLLSIYKLFPLKNATQFCKIEENNPHKGQEKVTSCTKEIYETNLEFEHGLDNYVFLLGKIYQDAIDIVPAGDPKNIEDKKVKVIPKNALFSTLQFNYIEYLFNEIAKITEDNKNLGNTAYWCKCKECEDDLRSVGFDGRMEGLDNYNILKINYGLKCDAMNTKTTEDYCHYLMDPELETISGTFDWCAKRFKVPDVPQEQLSVQHNT